MENKINEREERKNNKEKYPWLAYFAFGFHNIMYLNDDEVSEAVKFYRLKKIGNKFERYGRQPITIMPRE